MQINAILSILQHGRLAKTFDSVPPLARITSMMRLVLVFMHSLPCFVLFYLPSLCSCCVQTKQLAIKTEQCLIN